MIEPSVCCSNREVIFFDRVVVAARQKIGKYSAGCQAERYMQIQKAPDQIYLTKHMGFRRNGAKLPAVLVQCLIHKEILFLIRFFFRKGRKGFRQRGTTDSETLAVRDQPYVAADRFHGVC